MVDSNIATWMMMDGSTGVLEGGAAAAWTAVLRHGWRCCSVHDDAAGCTVVDEIWGLKCYLQLRLAAIIPQLELQ